MLVYLTYTVNSSRIYTKDKTMDFKVGQVNISVWSWSLKPNEKSVAVKASFPILGNDVLVEFKFIENYSNPLSVIVNVFKKEESHAEESIK